MSGRELGIIDSGDSRFYCRWKHSENWKIRKHRRDTGKSLFGSPKEKAFKAESRRREEEQLWEEEQFGMQLLKSRRRMQFMRALEHVWEETATPEEMDYIAQHGKVVERHTIPEGLKDPEVLEELPEIIVTIVDFTRPPV